jgi:YD repeat-containing protein
MAVYFTAPDPALAGAPPTLEGASATAAKAPHEAAKTPVLKTKAPASLAAAPEALGLTAHSGKVVVVDFWASWCKPCRMSLPWLAGMQELYAQKGLVVLTVNVDRERELADRFLTSLQAELPVVYDARGEIAKVYDVQGMPSSYVYDRSGRLRAAHLGFHPDDESELEDQLVALLAEENGNAR